MRAIRDSTNPHQGVELLHGMKLVPSPYVKQGQFFTMKDQRIVLCNNDPYYLLRLRFNLNMVRRLERIQREASDEWKRLRRGTMFPSLAQD
jgi:hypothetical protein